MASIKAAVAQDIVDSIITDVKRETDDINNSLVDILDKSIQEYHDEQYRIMNAKLDRIRESNDKTTLKKESELRFEVSQKLRDRRSELFAEFNDRLKTEVVGFLNSSDYANFLNDVVINNYKEGDVVALRKQDIPLITTKCNMREKEFELGGLMIESNQKVYDFTLMSRYKDALQAFIAKSNVNI